MRVLLRPRWLIGHVLIIAMSVLMLSLANWQHSRLDERKALNSEIKAGMAAPPVEIDSITVDAPAYTRVRVTGTWDPANTVYRRYVIVNGTQGFEMLEPMQVSGGLIYVNLGFVPIEKGKDKPLDFAAQNIVTIEGLLREPIRTDKRVGTVDASPNVPTMTEVDTEKLEQVSGREVAPVWVQLTSPVEPGGPVPLDPPDLNEGPHFSYMLQWIAFTITIWIGWIVLCWRTVRKLDE